MAVPIEIPGLDRFVSEVPDGRFVVLEGDMGPSKGFLASQLARSAAAAARPVTFLTTGRRSDAVEALGPSLVPAALPDIVEADCWEQVLDEAAESKDLIVDSFSLLALGVEALAMKSALRQLASGLGRAGGIAVLTVERGMLDPQVGAVLFHMADGVVQFHAREDMDGSVEFLRIPKWLQGRASGRNIYYGFEERRLSIDTRRRVN